MEIKEIKNFRESLEAAIAKKTKPDYLGEIKNLSITGPHGDLSLRTYTPNISRKMEAIFFIHGAGFVAGSLESHDNICRKLSQESSQVVIAVDYRLAPEYKYPIQLNECYHVLAWIAQHNEQLNITDTISLAGDSAGGCLAAACALKAAYEGRYKIARQLLINPFLKFDDPGKNIKFRDSYVNTKNEWKDPLASPFFGEPDKFPPTLIINCEHDDLNSQGELFANKLLDAGVRLKEIQIKKSGHLGSQFAAATPEADEAILACIEFLRNPIKIA